MTQKPALDNLIMALQCLPGVGAKSAQRMTYQLLQSDRQGALHLAKALQYAVEHTKHCKLCHTLTQNDLCDICSNTQRDCTLLCVVENPADQAAMEKTRTYNGLYYILMGRLSPLDGIGPDEIGLQQLYTRALDSNVREVILATNFTAEGEATAYMITQHLKAHQIKATRLARGVPAGAELEYVDLGTIAHALADRH